MSVETKIVCDGCGRPIEGEAGWPRNDYLSLQVAQAPTPPSNFTYGVGTYPMLARAHQFHNTGCLSHWLGTQHIAAIPTPA